MRTRLIVSLVACVAIAGCGSSSDSSKSTSTSAPAASSSSSSSSGGVTIKAAGFAFDPKSVTVKKGQKVTWTNSDSAPHNVTSSDGTIKSKDFTKGQSFTYTATKAGTFDYVCTIHPQMTATLIVQ
ncbi:MAG: cupredoxin family copper-binding protein [Solirubrobacteraceae bacterium]